MAEGARRMPEASRWIVVRATLKWKLLPEPINKISRSVLYNYVKTLSSSLDTLTTHLFASSITRGAQK